MEGAEAGSQGIQGWRFLSRDSFFICPATPFRPHLTKVWGLQDRSLLFMNLRLQRNPSQTLPTSSCSAPLYLHPLKHSLDKDVQLAGPPHAPMPLTYPPSQTLLPSSLPTPPHQLLCSATPFRPHLTKVRSLQGHSCDSLPKTLPPRRVCPPPVHLPSPAAPT